MAEHSEDFKPAITCDPRVQFGRACVAGTRITAETIAEMVWAGDTVDGLADSYEIGRDAVLWCCAWYVQEGFLRPRRGPRRVRWHQWSEHALLVLGGHRPGPLCDPDDFASIPARTIWQRGDR